MLFSALLALPLLSLTFANPLPNAEAAELKLRDATASLSARTFFEHDWRCTNDWAKTDCKTKGGEWACDKSCVCIQQPVVCATYCPLQPLKKVACELKWGYNFNDETCACEQEQSHPTTTAAPPPPTTTYVHPPPTTTYVHPPTTTVAPPPVDNCPLKDSLSAVCAKDQGIWNLSLCKCEFAKCPDCDGQSKVCSTNGGKWDDYSCKCTMPPPPPPTTTAPPPPPPTTTYVHPPTTTVTPPVDNCPLRDQLSSICAKDQGVWNLSLCKCESAKCPDCEGQGKDCSYNGGKWDDYSCKCTMPTPSTTTSKAAVPTIYIPKLPVIELPKIDLSKTCGSWWSIWLCKLKGKSCDGGCNCY